MLSHHTNVPKVVGVIQKRYRSKVAHISNLTPPNYCSCVQSCDVASFAVPTMTFAHLPTNGQSLTVSFEDCHHVVDLRRFTITDISDEISQETL